MKTNPVVEMVAAQLHREYRAAEQAMMRRHNPEQKRLPHDHGWICCSSKKYFLKRAAILIKRANVEAPQTLGETECALSALVLLRRVNVEGKLRIHLTNLKELQEL